MVVSLRKARREQRAQQLKDRKGQTSHKYKIYLGFTTAYIRSYYADYGKHPHENGEPPTIDIKLPSVYTLARYLNTYLKGNPYRLVHAVMIMDDDRPPQAVKFLPEETKNSHFYETAEERLQAVLKLTEPCDHCVELVGFNSDIFYHRGRLEKDRPFGNN